MNKATKSMLTRMRVAALAVALLAMAAAPAAASSQGTGASQERPSRLAPTYGRTLPPVGYVGFCQRRPEACGPRGFTFRRPRLDARQWALVGEVNAYVNAEISPASDEEIYGEAEHWDYPGRRGDCEDYALLKQRYLEVLGLPRAALLLTVVLDGRQEGHAVLTLATSEGDFILDNRRDAIRPWSASEYVFLKRQSQRDPRDWVALAPEPTMGPATLALRGAMPR